MKLEITCSLSGETDKHLDFRVSLVVADRGPANDTKNLVITTDVYFHNRMGRWYFVPVKPMHRIIVRVILQSMLRKLGTPSTASA